MPQAGFCFSEYSPARLQLCPSLCLPIKSLRFWVWVSQHRYSIILGVVASLLPILEHVEPYFCSASSAKVVWRECAICTVLHFESRLVNGIKLCASVLLMLRFNTGLLQCCFFSVSRRSGLTLTLCFECLVGQGCL